MFAVPFVVVDTDVFPQALYQIEPIHHSKQLVSVLKMVNPIAGFTMASLCAVVILGGRNPFEVELISTIAVNSGVAVPTEIVFVNFLSPPTVWLLVKSTKLTVLLPVPPLLTGKTPVIIFLERSIPVVLRSTFQFLSFDKS